MTNNFSKLDIPILRGILPMGWKTVIIYASGKYRSIPNSKYTLQKAHLYDKRGFKVSVLGKDSAHVINNEGKPFDQNSHRLIDTYINNDYLYYTNLGYKVTAEFSREYVLPSLEEINKAGFNLLDVPVIEKITDQMLDIDEYPKFNGKKTTAPRRRAPAKKCPIKVDFRRML